MKYKRVTSVSASRSQHNQNGIVNGCIYDFLLSSPGIHAFRVLGPGLGLGGPVLGPGLGLVIKSLALSLKLRL